MNGVLVAVDVELATALQHCGVTVAAWCEPAEARSLVRTAGARPALHDDIVPTILDEVGTIVLPAAHPVLDGEFVARCDRIGIRVVAVADSSAEEHRARSLGLACADARDPWAIARVLTTDAVDPYPIRPEADPAPGRVVAVWGPAGAPGRSTVAVMLAAELARGGRRTALVDADSHAPSLALMLGVADEGPGFAAACRAADSGRLDVDELDRIAVPVSAGDTTIAFLAGLNRPGRWPELESDRVAGALAVTRTWAEYTVVDVAAPLERDEEIVSDLDGPRRNAAALAVLDAADLVVAVGSADPIGVSRLVRSLTDLRAATGPTPVRVLVNRLRQGPLGLDGRGQVRGALERFAGVDDAWFLPADAKATDAALLTARPVADAAPRSPLVAAVRRFVGEAVVPAFAPLREEPRATPRRGRDRGRDRASFDADLGHTVMPSVLTPRPRRGRAATERRSA